MVKAVAVLSGSEGVKGHVFFAQEGDGNFMVFNHLFWQYNY